MSDLNTLYKIDIFVKKELENVWFDNYYLIFKMYNFQRYDLTSLLVNLMKGEHYLV